MDIGAHLRLHSREIWLPSRDIWLRAVFPQQSRRRDAHGRLQGAAACGSLVPLKGILGEVPSSCIYHLSQGSSLFLPCPALTPNYAFPDGTERCLWTSRGAPRPSQSIGVYPADFSFERKELFGCFANWFWCVSAIEDPLWALRVFWVFCQLFLMCVWRQGPLVLGSVFLGLCIGHACWRVCDSSIFWYVGVCVFVWLVFLLPFVKWEIQVHFMRKILAVILWLKKKIIF